MSGRVQVLGGLLFGIDVQAVMVDLESGNHYPLFQTDHLKIYKTYRI